MLNLKIRHCDVCRNFINTAKKIPTCVGMTAFWLCLSISAHAKDGDTSLSDILAESTLPEGANRYAPENCDFELIFPSEPYTSKRCAKDSKKCTSLTSYTMVYDVTTTIEVSVSCAPSSPAQYESYSEAVIATALKGMVSRGNITDHEIHTRQEADFRQGALLGSATRGKQSAVYAAQLWVGQNSVLTIEGKLIGPSHTEADTAFGDILSSVKEK